MPEQPRKPGPKRRRSLARKRAEAVEIAADMETGRYVDPEGYAWPARPFVVAQILRHMGYGAYTAEQHHLPVWWAGPRGDGRYGSRTGAMRRLVAVKVMLWQIRSEPGPGAHPWLHPLLAAAVEELLRRLYERPEIANNRELVKLTGKLARMQQVRRRLGQLASPGQIAEREGLAYQRIAETIRALPSEEQERARVALERTMGRLRETLSAANRGGS